MSDDLPFISVIVPCRNEDNFIGKCLDSIISQDWPKENLEVLVIDGASEDKTRKIIGEYTKKFPFIKVLENPQKYTPFGLNIGIKNAKGNAIVRMDAHAGYEKDYISKCIKYLKEYNADNVGGVIKTIPARNTIAARAIAFCLSNFFGVASSFRLGTDKAKEVDTVFGGCYKKEIFQKIGFFNEKLIRSQDIEFNLRLKKAGGKIVLIPEIISYYFPSSDLASFLEHNILDGIWVTYPLKFGIRIFKLRHLIPLFFVLGVILPIIFSPFSFIARVIFVIIFGVYLAFNLFFSFETALKSGFRYFFVMPIAFFSRHFGYGLGSIWGLIRILI